MKGAAACTALLATLLCGHAAPGDPVLPQMPLQQPAQPVQPVQPVQQPPQLPMQPPMVPVQPVPVAPKPPKPVPVVPVVPPPVIPMKNWLLPNGNIDFRRLPPWTRCVQNTIPPGVKPGACMQVMCMPKTVQPGDVFHIRVRFCMQRPRRWHLTFGLLDQKTKEFYGGAGAGIVDTKTQCGEVTFEHPFDAGETPAGGFDLMWKFFIIPNHGMNGFYVEDTFPNMIAEAGVDQQPNYLAPLDPAADCPAQDMLQWNLPPTGYQNGIEYTVIPKCFQPGVAWIIQVDTHLETDDAADLHCNLQIGSGADIYLGPADEFIAEYKVNALKANPKTNSWAAIPKGYWTTTPVLFTAAETALVEPGSPVYVSCFMTPVDAVFNKLVPGGWKILEREFYLAMQFCEDGAFNDLDGDGAEDVPTDYDLDGDGTVDGEMAQPNPNYVDLNGDGIAAEQDHNADLIPDVDLNKDGIVDDLDGNGVPEIIPPVIYGPEGDAVVPPGAIPGGGVALPPGVEVGEDGDIFIDADADGVDDRYDGVFVDDNGDGLDDAEEAAAAAEAAAQVPDVTVGPVDANNDGVDDADEYIDLNNNGIDDNLEEPDVTEAAVTEGPVSATYVDANNDGINDADELPDASVSVTGSESETGSETGFVDNNFNGINDADEGLRRLL